MQLYLLLGSLLALTGVGEAVDNNDLLPDGTTWSDYKTKASAEEFELAKEMHRLYALFNGKEYNENDAQNMKPVLGKKVLTADEMKEAIQGLRDSLTVKGIDPDTKPGSQDDSQTESDDSETKTDDPDDTDDSNTKAESSADDKTNADSTGSSKTKSDGAEDSELGEPEDPEVNPQDPEDPMVEPDKTKGDDE